MALVPVPTEANSGGVTVGSVAPLIRYAMLANLELVCVMVMVVMIASYAMVPKKERNCP